MNIYKIKTGARQQPLSAEIMSSTILQKFFLPVNLSVRTFALCNVVDVRVKVRYVVCNGFVTYTWDIIPSILRKILKRITHFHMLLIAPSLPVIGY